MLTRKTLSLADAKTMAAAASAKATAEGWNVVIAIHDNGGNLHLPGARRRHAAGFGRRGTGKNRARRCGSSAPPRCWKTPCSAGRVHMMSLPGITSVEGGLPLIRRWRGRGQHRRLRCTVQPGRPGWQRPAPRHLPDCKGVQPGGLTSPSRVSALLGAPEHRPCMPRPNSRSAPSHAEAMGPPKALVDADGQSHRRGGDQQRLADAHSYNPPLGVPSAPLHGKQTPVAAGWSPPQPRRTMPQHGLSRSCSRGAS